MATIAQRIREGLALRNLKQVDIVERTGINKGALSSYISGKYQPKQANIALIAGALGVREDWLMGQDVPMERQENGPVDEELSGYLEELKNRSEMRMLFQLAKGATKADVERAAKIIEALRERDDE